MGGKRSIPKVETLRDEASDLYRAVKDESPLACALIVGSAIEKAILALVGNYFVDCETAKELLGENGNLGTFASCSKVAYSLGLISKGVFQNINEIGHIRNFFAHSNIYTDFKHPYVIELCRKLKFHPQTRYYVAGKDEPIPLDSVDLRVRYSSIGAAIFHTLLVAADSIEHKQRYTDEWDHQAKH